MYQGLTVRQNMAVNIKKKYYFTLFPTTLRDSKRQLLLLTLFFWVRKLRHEYANELDRGHSEPIVGLEFKLGLGSSLCTARPH